MQKVAFNKVIKRDFLNNQLFPLPCNLISQMNSMMDRFVWDDDSKQYETHGGIDE
jgi:hypothetical protein